MPAARYWRVVGVETYAGGDLELSELHLYGASGRLDAVATLTSTIAPTAGTLAALQDDDSASTCRFAGTAVRAGGFALMWDFGVGNTADALGVRLGAATAPDTFLAGGTLQYSTDGVQWVFFDAYNRFRYPGAGAYTTVPTAGDPDFDKVSLLLLMTGTDNSSVFVDSSKNSYAQYPSSSAKIIRSQADPFGNSDGVGYFSGVGHQMTAVAAALPSGSEDATLELYVHPENAGNTRVLVNRSTAGFNLEIRSSGLLGLYFYGPGTYISGGYVPNLAWSHVAFTRQGNTFRLFVNGQIVATTTQAISFDGTQSFIGSTHDGTLSYKGCMSGLRVTKGTARYTANFTPPTAPPPLHTSVPTAPPLLRTSVPTMAHIAASAPVPAFSTRRAAPLQLARDVEHGGPGTIYGTTKTKGTPNTPAHARIVLLHQRSKMPVREVWSDPITGAFVFEGIDTTQQFLTLAEDAAGNFRPVAASRLVPEVAP